VESASLVRRANKPYRPSRIRGARLRAPVRARRYGARHMIADAVAIIGTQDIVLEKSTGRESGTDHVFSPDMGERACEAGGVSPRKNWLSLIFGDLMLQLSPQEDRPRDRQIPARRSSRR